MRLFKTLLLVLLPCVAYCQAQERKPIFNPSFVRITLTGKEFAEWLESINEWADYKLENTYVDTSYTHKYVLAPPGQGHVLYTYFFKNTNVVAVNVEPAAAYKPEEYEAEIAKTHNLINRKQVSENIEKVFFKNEAQNYKLMLVKEKKDNGFKVSYQCSIWCRKGDYEFK